MKQHPEFIFLFPPLSSPTSNKSFSIAMALKYSFFSNIFRYLKEIGFSINPEKKTQHSTVTSSNSLSIFTIMKWSDWNEKVKTSFIAVKKSSCNGSSSDIKIKSLRYDRQQILISNFTVILAHSELSQFIFHGFQFNFDGLINSYHFIAHCVCASSSESERTCNKFYSHHTQSFNILLHNFVFSSMIHKT